MNQEELENIQKIKALFLNKIEKLNWYYFQLNFSSYGSYSPKKMDEINAFLNDIININGKYEYTGAQIELEKIFPILLSYIKANPDVIGNVTKRIFDIKDSEILDKSDAYQGNIGKFNESDRKYRNKIYLERIKTLKRDETHFVLLAEGDSWFEFPKMYAGVRFLGKDMVKDILDWLIGDENYAVYSLAAGADWLSNMMYMGEYIAELPKVSPDAFLISGGGNDMVGDHRLATMVRNPYLQGKLDLGSEECPQAIKQLKEIRKKQITNEAEFEKYILGLSLLADDFYNFLNVCLAQYFLFFYNLNTSKEYQKMIFITQGYDFVIPTNKRRGNWFSSQHIENSIINSGKWLYEALQMKGITNPDEQKAVLYACIYEFNEMLILLANYFPNVYHIDNRGVASSTDAWFDEIHLKSKYFEKVANTYKKCIQENARNPKGMKVYKTIDYN